MQLWYSRVCVQWEIVIKFHYSWMIQLLVYPVLSTGMSTYGIETRGGRDRERNRKKMGGGERESERGYHGQQGFSPRQAVSLRWKWLDFHTFTAQNRIPIRLKYLSSHLSAWIMNRHIFALSSTNSNNHLFFYASNYASNKQCNRRTIITMYFISTVLLHALFSYIVIIQWLTTGCLNTQTSINLSSLVLSLWDGITKKEWGMHLCITCDSSPSSPLSSFCWVDGFSQLHNVVQ